MHAAHIPFVKPARLILLSLGLAACGAAPTVGPALMTVQGVAVADGSPLAGAKVQLNHGAVLTTGADGTFTFGNVSAPYTLTVATALGVQEYRGLKTNALHILTGPEMANLSTATVSGQIGGVALPLPSGQAFAVGASDSALALAPGSVDGATGSYAATLMWPKGNTAVTTLSAVRVSFSGGGISAYESAGSRSGLALSKGTGVTGVNIPATSPVLAAPVSVNFNLGAYADFASASLMSFVASGTTFTFPVGPPVTSGSNVLIPTAGASLLLQGKHASGAAMLARRRALPGSFSFSAPPAVTLINSAPGDSATGTSRTPALHWSAVTGATSYQVNLRALPGSARYTFWLPGDVSSLTLPDYTVLGAPLAGGSTYGWEVRAHLGSGFEVDRMADGNSGATLYKLLALNEWTVYDSVKTTFTTAP